ncbi:MAG TPA: phosphatase PAP2 family protein [Solirubrobacteraceae bacterium]|nr:phosphatase PAP2 family protein [Solirubrobacteraceae bacterium]
MRTVAKSWLSEAAEVDRAVYNAVSMTPTPRMDAVMRKVSTAANYSRLSIAIAALMGAVGGPRGRRAAASGLVSVGATAAIINLVIKPLGRRRRPERPPAGARAVPMPSSRSFPSGHTAAAVAFASGVARELPLAGVPLQALAALVGYSRVHTGVHYPGDVVAGALLGAGIADVATSVVIRPGR